MSHKARGYLLGTLGVVVGVAGTADAWSSALHKGHFYSYLAFGPTAAFIGLAGLLAPEAFGQPTERRRCLGEWAWWRILPWHGRVLVLIGFAGGFLNAYLLMGGEVHRLKGIARPRAAVGSARSPMSLNDGAMTASDHRTGPT
jgi:hypothetical protein